MITDLDHWSGSWIIVDHRSGRLAGETFDRRTAEAIDQDIFEVLTAYQWLTRHNRRIKEGRNVGV